MLNLAPGLILGASVSLRSVHIQFEVPFLLSAYLLNVYPLSIFS